MGSQPDEEARINNGSISDRKQTDQDRSQEATFKSGLNPSKSQQSHYTHSTFN